MPVKFGSIQAGSGCTGCGGTACGSTLCVTGCPGGTALVGASVTISRGGTVIHSGTTVADGHGNACVGTAIPASADYQVAVSATGYKPYTGTKTIHCGDTTTIQLAASTSPAGVKFAVTGCCSLPLAGAAITLSDGQTGTTDSTGACSFWFGTGGTITYAIAKSRWATATGSFTIASCSAAPTTNLPVTMAPATGYVCGGAIGNTGALAGCAEPLPTTLFLTDSLYGGCTLAWDAGTASWKGTITCTAQALCGCPGGQTFTLTYSLPGNCDSIPNNSCRVCEYRDQFQDTLYVHCKCDATIVYGDGSKLNADVFSCGETITSYTAAGIPYSFSGTIPSTVCLPDNCSATLHPSGATITISE